MPKFSKTSLDRLYTCQPDLRTLFHYVVKKFDCHVLYGYRSAEKQFELYKQGREMRNGSWIIVDKSIIVTYKDGYEKKSKHNTMPSDAVDVVPYPIEWKNVNRMRYFVGYVKGIAEMLLRYGAMDHEIVSGIDWDNDTVLKDQRFNDLPHFQIKY